MAGTGLQDGAPLEVELKTAHAAIEPVLADFEPIAHDSMVPGGRKFLNYFALSCATVSVGFVALGVRAARTLASDTRAAVCFGLALLYPMLPAAAAGLGAVIGAA